MAAARSRPATLAPLLAVIILAPAAPAKGQGALWCLPAVAERVAKPAEACGHPLPPGARARVDRMGEACLAAVERAKGPEFAQKWRVEFRRMSALPPVAIAREHRAVQLSRFKESLDQLSSPDKGGAMARRAGQEAAASGDPVAGPCL